MSRRLSPGNRWSLTAAAVLAGSLTLVGAAQGPGAARVMDGDDIAGVVTSVKGAEAGVWVIAETTDLPTRYVKIVVTDERGRYLLCDLARGSRQNS